MGPTGGESLIPLSVYVFYKVAATLGVPLIAAILLTTIVGLALEQKSPKTANKLQWLFYSIWGLIAIIPIGYALYIVTHAR
jgi:predicted membrane channel-forming protein YqfA (hemolysin III family)